MVHDTALFNKNFLKIKTRSQNFKTGYSCSLCILCLHTAMLHQAAACHFRHNHTTYR